MQTNLCDDETLSKAAALMAQGDAGAAEAIDALVGKFPNDPRLTFLQASMLVAIGRLVAAHDAFARTLALAPDFALARYQYGFFLLTSGEVARALEVWGPLDRLPDGDYLRGVLDGMRCLVRDDFAGVRSHFQTAISRNMDNEPLNNDLRLLLQRLDQAIEPDKQFGADQGAQLGDERDGLRPAAEPEALSEASLLLQRFGTKLH